MGDSLNEWMNELYLTTEFTSVNEKLLLYRKAVIIEFLSA